MLSEKEMRAWGIGIMVLVWVMLIWAIADHLLWSPEGTPSEVIHQLAQKVRLLAHGVTVLVVVGLVMMTRLMGFFRSTCNFSLLERCPVKFTLLDSKTTF
jgi:hypothetical protein